MFKLHAYLDISRYNLGVLNLKEYRKLINRNQKMCACRLNGTRLGPRVKFVPEKNIWLNKCALSCNLAVYEVHLEGGE